MELKEYLQIFKVNIKLFVFVIALAVAGSFLYFFLKPVSYTASLIINITRSGMQETSEYRYDDFYRLQADEKFAETIVEWLKNPRTVVDVYAKAGIKDSDFSLRQMAKVFTPEKRSSQVVAVSFSAGNEKSAEEISNALVAVVSQNIQMLNEKQNEDSWFEVVAQDPVIVLDSMRIIVVLLSSLAMGVFLGFWAVMVRHYLK